MAQTRSQSDALLLAGMNLIQQAISVFDQDMKLVVFNQPMLKMFDLPEEITVRGTSFADVIRTLAALGEYGEVGDLEEFVAATSNWPKRLNRIIWSAKDRTVSGSASRAHLYPKAAG